MNKENYNNGINVKDVLSHDETILWQGKPNKKSYITKLIGNYFSTMLITGIILGILFLFVYLTSFDIISCIFFGLMGLIFLVPFILSTIILIPKIVETKNIEYVVTDKKLLYKGGIIGVDYKTLLYTDVNKVTLLVGFMDKLFKDGTISLIGNNNSIKIHSISNCYDLYSKLYKIILDIQTDIKYPNALRADNNPGYNTKKEKR